eukprot:m.190480 g.190480  ORF g.190480 m.190480 type:complete len:391 (+) comp32405_c11_seq1:249-1421(+)
MSTTAIGILVLSVLVASHYVQRWLPAPKPKIIGIDLGTTYSCVGVYRAGVGTVDILADEQGSRTIPSVVAFTEGNILVGVAAKKQRALNPKNTIYESKRFMGKPFNAVVHDTLDRFPFKIVNQSGKPVFEVSTKDTPMFYTPEEIGAAVIGELKRTAELSLNAKITQAVMSVPAEFTPAQRNATIKAGALAGLEILRILSEPTAAAMAYGLHTKDQTNFIVVFDFGGGTLDVSLLMKQGGMFTTVAIAGNKHLGGEDLSHAFFEFALELVEQKLGHALTDAYARQRLRTAVELAKLDLSSSLTHTISLQINDDDNDGDDIPEEIVSSHNKKQAWFSVDEQSRTGGDDVPALEKVDLSTGKVLETISTNTRAQKKTKMIEVVGGDDMDGLD